MTTNSLTTTNQDGFQPMIFESTARWSDRARWTADTLIRDAGAVATFEGHVQRNGCCLTCSLMRLRAGDTFKAIMRIKARRNCHYEHDPFMQEWARQLFEAQDRGESTRAFFKRTAPHLLESRRRKNKKPNRKALTR